jgi:hypothetical protein
VIQQVWDSNVDTFRIARKIFGRDHIAAEHLGLHTDDLHSANQTSLLQKYTVPSKFVSAGLGSEKLSDTTTYDFRILINISAAGTRIQHKRELLT